jgi:hypothetical protein
MASGVEWAGLAASTATLCVVVWLQFRGEQLSRERDAASNRLAEQRLRAAEAKQRAERARAHDAVIEQYVELGDRALELVQMSIQETHDNPPGGWAGAPRSLDGIRHLEMLADVLGEAPDSAAETKLIIKQLRTVISSPYADGVQSPQSWRDELNRRSLRLRRVVGMLRSRRLENSQESDLVIPE